MNEAQWLAEYYALREKERTERDNVIAIYKASVRGLRDVLIDVLGLRLGAPKKAATAGNNGSSATKELNDSVTSFNPMILYCGRPDVLKQMLEFEEKGPNEDRDQAFDELVDHLSVLDDAGDLEPLDLDELSDNPKTKWSSPYMKKLLREAGVDVDEDVDEDEGEGAGKDAELAAVPSLTLESSSTTNTTTEDNGDLDG